MSTLTLSREQRVIGAFFGGIAGDALGYPVEFLTRDQMLRQFGPEGIQSYALNEQGLALFSDDTQMMLFTATGYIHALIDKSMFRLTVDPVDYLYDAYLDWLETQGEEAPHPHTSSFIKSVKALNHRRAPGNTCLSALRSGQRGTLRKPINQSKGCGGIMRVSPIPLLSPDLSIQSIMKTCAAAAALTHGHPLGYLPAAIFGGLIHLIISHGEQPFTALVEGTLDAFHAQYKKHPSCEPLMDYLLHALKLCHSKASDAEIIHTLGGGWVAEEALAIALFCTARHIDDLSAVLIAAVNHDGDSDSTGLIAGTLAGAYLGIDALDSSWITPLEALPLLQTLSSEMLCLPTSGALITDPRLLAHYIQHQPYEDENFDQIMTMWRKS